MNETVLYLRRTASSGLLNSAASAACVVLVLPAIIAGLGFEAYGYWAILGAFVGIAGLFDLGMSKALVFLIPAEPAAEGELVSGAVLLCLAVALAAVAIFALCVVVGVPVFGPIVAQQRQLSWSLAAAGATILVCQVLTTLVRAVLEARCRAHLVNTGFALFTVAYYGIAVLLAYIAADVRIVIAASAGVFVLNLVAHLQVLRIERPVRWCRPTRPLLRGLARIALRTFAVDLPSIAYLPLMLWVFLAFAPSGSAYGAFDLATRIAVLCATALSTLAVPFYALVAGARAGDGQAVRRLLDRFVPWTLALAALGWFAFLLVGERLLAWWMPEAPAGLATALRIVLAGCLLQAALEPATRLLLGLGYLRRLFTVRVGMLAVCAVLLLALRSLPVLEQFAIAVGAGWMAAAALLALALRAVRWGRTS